MADSSSEDSNSDGETKGYQGKRKQDSRLSRNQEKKLHKRNKSDISSPEEEVIPKKTSKQHDQRHRHRHDSSSSSDEETRKKPASSASGWKKLPKNEEDTRSRYKGHHHVAKEEGDDKRYRHHDSKKRHIKEEPGESDEDRKRYDQYKHDFNANEKYNRKPKENKRKYEDDNRCIKKEDSDREYEKDHHKRNNEFNNSFNNSPDENHEKKHYKQDNRDSEQSKERNRYDGKNGNGHNEDRREKEWDKGKNKESEDEPFDSRRFGNSTSDNAAATEKKPEKEEANFGLSGKLTEFTNTYNGIVIMYNEPPEARKPKTKWRFYPFKEDKGLTMLQLHRQSAFLLGRDRKVADIPVDHPSCSKQHAVLQFRLVDYERPDGSMGKRVKPYIIDLDSRNGTHVNNKRIEGRRYVELREKDVVKFGFSSRDYVLLHEKSQDVDSSADEGSDGETKETKEADTK